MLNKKYLLKFQYDIGIDEVIKDDNYISPISIGENEKQLNNGKLEMIPTATLSRKESKLDEIYKIVDKIKTIEELKEYLQHFKDLDICKTATNMVFSDGNPNSDIMLLGEAPGANEDAQGIPFCGQSGKLLDNMLKTIGISRDNNLYITNNVFWRPPANRKPLQEEIDFCRPFVEKHIALIKPKLLLLVGSTAISALLNTKDGISKLRGQIVKYSNKYLDHEINTMATFHPSYLLRQPSQKKLAWQDLQVIIKFMHESNIKV